MGVDKGGSAHVDNAVHTRRDLRALRPMRGGRVGLLGPDDALHSIHVDCVRAGRCRADLPRHRLPESQHQSGGAAAGRDLRADVERPQAVHKGGARDAAASESYLRNAAEQKA